MFVIDRSCRVLQKLHLQPAARATEAELQRIIESQHQNLRKFCIAQEPFDTPTAPTVRTQVLRLPLLAVVS